jgi:hypothetical protein
MDKPDRKTESRKIDTGGGAYVEGHVDTGGGDFVGRDQIKSGLSSQELERLFAPLKAAVQQAPDGNRQAALQITHDLEQEVAKGDQADDSRMAKLIDGLVGLVPAAVSAVVSIFASPILGGLAGPVTQFVLDKIQGK